MPPATSTNEHSFSLPSTPRCAIYARFSSEDHQDETSNEDQIRECRAYAARQGWMVLDEYVRRDDGKTGQVVVGRDGLNDLLCLAEQRPRPYDFLLIYHTSRL
jgi:DNA invertase Pin-like site-specific DNA recombinase